MANAKQREEARSRKPRHRKNFEMEELPTFAKWLTSFRDDGNSKSKRPKRAPTVALDASEKGGVVPADVPEEEGVAMGDSRSMRGGCCCWRRSKSTPWEFSPKSQISLSRRTVVQVEGVAAGVSDHREEEVVAAGSGCWCCRCLPTFQICGRSKVPAGVPNLPEEGSGHRHSESARRTCLLTFHICGRRKMAAVADVPNLHKEEGVATDVPDLRMEEVAASGPDSVEEGKATVDPDLCKEWSGCGCWECSPALQIGGRRRRMKVVADNEEVTADVPNVSEEGVTSDVLNPGRKEKVVVGVSDLQEEEEVAAAVLELRGEVDSKSAGEGSCWPFQFCVRGWLPKFFLCGGRTAVDAPNHREEEEEERASAGVPDLQNGVVSGDNLDHCKEERVSAGDIPVLSKEEMVSAGDTPDLHKEEKVYNRSVPDLQKEEAVATGVQDLCKEEEEEEGGCRCFKLAGKVSGRRHRRRSSRSKEEGCWPFQICWPFNICRERISIPNSHEEEVLVVNGVSNVNNEVEVVAATDGSKPRRRWLPTFQIFRRKTVATDTDGGSRRSNSKRKRRCLRRRGRKPRETKR